MQVFLLNQTQDANFSYAKSELEKLFVMLGGAAAAKAEGGEREAKV